MKEYELEIYDDLQNDKPVSLDRLRLLKQDQLIAWINHFREQYKAQREVVKNKREVIKALDSRITEINKLAESAKKLGESFSKD